MLTSAMALLVAAVTLLCVPSHRAGAAARRHRPETANEPPDGSDSSSHPGIDATIAAVIARTRGGGGVTEAFEEQGGIRFASARVTASRVERVLTRTAARDESAAEVARVSRRLAAACRLSGRLGCEVSHCLEAVASDHRRERRASALRRQVFAAPQATIRLLSALPAVTVVLAELMGAHPLAFLLETPQGLSCLLVGSLWYAAGMVWTRRLLRGFADQATRPAVLPFALQMLHTALARGTSIPMALETVGTVLRESETAPDENPDEAIDPLPGMLIHAGTALLRGASWYEAWPRAPDGGDAATVRDCLDEAWLHGASPTDRLALAVGQADADERAAIEREAGTLSVRLLAPTGLCFLPAFVCIGVVPAIISFVI
ncbi:hypothetical protein [Bifidobacterium sp. CP2]|uniref:type II secretion system F family protein n=1 Tax=Bifidobacterium sp. CP2 TaxID=2809025 RepID=UPI001F0A56F5|nr:hypothetical protein [Bifidobacterium sp. CP2]